MGSLLKFSKSLDLYPRIQILFRCLFFLCAGDYGDHSFAHLRSLSLHFAKNNIQDFSKLHSSQPLNLYCMIDPSLSNDQAFLNILFCFTTTMVTRLIPDLEGSDAGIRIWANRTYYHRKTWSRCHHSRLNEEDTLGKCLSAPLSCERRAI